MNLQNNLQPLPEDELPTERSSLLVSRDLERYDRGIAGLGVLMHGPEAQRDVLKQNPEEQRDDVAAKKPSIVVVRDEESRCDPAVIEPEVTTNVESTLVGTETGDAEPKGSFETLAFYSGCVTTAAVTAGLTVTGNIAGAGVCAAVAHSFLSAGIFASGKKTEANVARVQAETEGMRRDVGRIEEKIGEVNKKVGAVNDKLEAFKQTTEERLNNMDKRLNNMDRRLVRVETRLTDVETRLVRVETRLDDIDNRLDTMEASLRRVEEMLRAMQRPSEVHVIPEEKVSMGELQERLMSNRTLMTQASEMGAADLVANLRQVEESILEKMKAL